MLKQLVMILALVSFYSTFALAQEKPETEKKEKQECMKDSHSCCGKHEMHSEMKMEDSKETANAQAWNKVCPVKGEEVDTEVATVEYNGKQYGFCCPGCDSKFTKDPNQYSKNLSEDGTEFIGG
jgi:YHS domain-containing protein